jgi:hypothetical protein
MFAEVSDGSNDSIFKITLATLFFCSFRFSLDTFTGLYLNQIFHALLAILTAFLLLIIPSTCCSNLKIEENQPSETPMNFSWTELHQISPQCEHRI